MKNEHLCINELNVALIISRNLIGDGRRSFINTLAHQQISTIALAHWHIVVLAH